MILDLEQEFASSCQIHSFFQYQIIIMRVQNLGACMLVVLSLVICILRVLRQQPIFFPRIAIASPLDKNTCKKLWTRFNTKSSKEFSFMLFILSCEKQHLSINDKQAKGTARLNG